MSEIPSAALVDWGTSSLRIWLVDAGGHVLGQRASAQGMRVAIESGFDGILEDHVAELGAGPGVPALVCGMAGAKGAWVEAGYLDMPANLNVIAEQATLVPGSTRKTYILPGAAKRVQDDADVMRGEETILLGASLAADDGSDRLYCLPGTHSKWARMSAGEIRDFRTYMTGELFDAISNHTIIRQSVENASGDTGYDPGGPFGRAVRDAYTNPQRFTNLLFGIRGNAVLFGAHADVSRETLSGYLIGMEIAGEIRGEDDISPISLIASGILQNCYEAAFDALKIPCQTHSAEDLVLGGLTHAARKLSLLD